MRKLLRNGAPILLVFSCIVFVGLLTYQFMVLNELQRGTAAGMYRGELPSTWLAVVGAVSGALSSAAIPFFAACVIDRADRFLAVKEAAE